ncbi:MAG: hypothetical protein ACOC1O_06270 [bacterium]
MKCYYHPEKNAVSQCTECGRGLCKECFDYNENVCESCTIKIEKELKEMQKKSKEKEGKFIKKKIVYLIISFVLAGIFVLNVYNPLNSFEEFTWTIFFLLLLGSIPSGYRVMTRITQNKILPDNMSDRVVLFPGAILILYFVKAIIGYFIGIFAFLYEIYEIIKYYMTKNNDTKYTVKNKNA